MTMKLRELTADEWFHIRTLRSQDMTGQNAHRTKHVPINSIDPTYVRGAGKTYHWCMGLQPDKGTIKKIARRCPIKAAEAYLAMFEKNDTKKWPQGFVKPIARQVVTS